MNVDGRRHDRLIRALCLILCPAISGMFLGSVAILCVYPSAADHALEVGALVACAAFLANAFAICLTAAAADGLVHLRSLCRPGSNRPFVVVPNFELPELDIPSFERVDHRMS
jgi:hypothetical protein